MADSETTTRPSAEIDIYSDLAWAEFFTDLHNTATAEDSVPAPDPQLPLGLRP